MEYRGRKNWALAGAVLVGLASVLSSAWIRRMTDTETLAAQARQAVDRQEWARAGSLLSTLAKRRAVNANDVVLRAQVEMGQGRPDRAIGLLTDIPESDPLAAPARVVAGQIEKSRNRAVPTERLFTDAVRLDPRLTQARRELILLYATQARREELNAQFRALAEIETLSFDDVFLWTNSFDDLWINDTIRPSLERYLAADAGDRASRLALAAVMLKGGQVNEAESLLVPLPATDVDALVLRIRIELSGNRLDRARELLAGGPLEHPGLALLRAQFTARSNESTAAERHFRTALRLDPRTREALQGLSLVLKQMGRIEESEKYRLEAEKWRRLTGLLQKSKTFNIRDDVTLLTELGAACEDVGQVAEARAWYRLALGVDPLQPAVQKSLFRLRDRPGS